jgi:hypothetical protein
MKGIIPQGKPWTQNRFGGSIPLKTAKLFKGQEYGFLRPRLNGETVQQTTFGFHSHLKWNQQVGSASLVRWKINRF